MTSTRFFFDKCHLFVLGYIGVPACLVQNVRSEAREFDYQSSVLPGSHGIHSSEEVQNICFVICPPSLLQRFLFLSHLSLLDLWNP